MNEDQPEEDRKVPIAVLGGPHDGRDGLHLYRSLFSHSITVEGAGDHYHTGRVDSEGKAVFAWQGCEGVLELKRKGKGEPNA